MCDKRFLKISSFDYDIFKDEFEKNVKKDKEDLIKNLALEKELNKLKKQIQIVEELISNREQ